MSTHKLNLAPLAWRVQRAHDVYPLAITEGDAIIAVIRETISLERTPEARSVAALKRARMMAVAPQALSSMKRMLEMMEHDHAEEIANDHHGDDSCSYCDWMDEARALIAQADCEVSA